MEKYIIKAIKEYESIYGRLNIHKNSKIHSKENLIKGLLITNSEERAVFFKYKNKSTLSVGLKRIFINKPPKLDFRDWLLGLINVRECTSCKYIKSLEDFSIDTRKYNGKQSHCKLCKSTTGLERNYSKLHYIANKPMYIAKEAKRRAAKLQRTPSWLTDEDHWMFEEIYSLTKLREELTGIKWHVDHIIPLQGEIVCGLHVPTNLQVITATENLSKSNKFNI